PGTGVVVSTLLATSTAKLLIGAEAMVKAKSSLPGIGSPPLVPICGSSPSGPGHAAPNGDTLGAHGSKTRARTSLPLAPNPPVRPIHASNVVLVCCSFWVWIGRDDADKLDWNTVPGSS